MEKDMIQISHYDFSLLNEMVLEMWCRGVQNELLKKLNRKLDCAAVVSEYHFPPDVVTLNSRLCIEDIRTLQETTCTLVVDEHQDAKFRAVPILSRLGVALIGQAVGSSITLDEPEQHRQIRISKLLFQPEVEFNRYHVHMKSILN